LIGSPRDMSVMCTSGGEVRRRSLQNSLKMVQRTNPPVFLDPSLIRNIIGARSRRGSMMSCYSDEGGTDNWAYTGSPVLVNLINAGWTFDFHRSHRASLSLTLFLFFRVCFNCSWNLILINSGRQVGRGLKVSDSKLCVPPWNCQTTF